MRHATARDLRKCAVLTQYRDSFMQHWTMAELGSWIEEPDGALLVAEYEGVMLGLVLFGNTEPDEGFWIEGPYVSPLFRRLGIGSTLLNHVLAHLKPGEQAEILADERADALLLFLRHHGFKAVEILRDREGVRSDRYRMVFKLAEQAARVT